MAGSTIEHRTVLSIEADTRGLDKVGPSLEDALRTDALEKLEDRTKQTQESMSDLAEQIGKVRKELEATGKAAGAFDDISRKLEKLEQQHERVGRQRDRLKQQLSDMRSQERQQRSEDQQAARALGYGTAAVGGFAGGSAAGGIIPIAHGFTSAAGAGPLGAALALPVAAGAAGLISGLQFFGEFEQYALQRRQIAPMLGNPLTRNAGTLEALTGVKDKPGALIQAGADYGMTPTETLQAIGQFFGARGGTADEKTLRTVLGAQQFGANLGQSAMFLRQFQPGRGGLETPGAGIEVMAKAIGQATALGLEGSEVGEYLSNIAATLQRSEQTGNRIAAAGVLGFANRLGGAGLLGQRGANVAGQMIGAAQGVGFGGPNTALESAMFQAAGFKGGGPLEFAQAARRLQEHPEEVLPVLINNLRQQTQGLPPELAGFMLQQMLAPLAHLGFGEAMGVAGKGLRKGKAGAGGLTAKSLAETGIRLAGEADFGIGKERAELAIERLSVGSSEALRSLTRTTQGLQIAFANATETIASLVRRLGRLLLNEEGAPQTPPEGRKKATDLFRGPKI